MNRPNATDEKYLKGYDVLSYQKDLELYCDILEECIKTDNVGMNQERDYYRKKIEELGNMLNDSYQGHLLKVIIPRLEREIENQKVTIQNLSNRIVKLTKALKECCRHSSCRYITNIKEEYCELNKGNCEECLFNHYMKGVYKDG